MKLFTKLSLIATALVLSFQAQAQNARYTFKVMECVGTINQKPKAMHPDYVNFGLRVIHFTPKKKDGTRVNSLGWNTFYGQTLAEVKQEMATQRYGGEVWYTGQLNMRQMNGQSYAYYSKFSDRFIGQIIPDNNPKVDYMKARFTRKYSVVGHYYYDLKCKVVR